MQLSVQQDLIVEDLVENKLKLQVLTDTGWSDFSGIICYGDKKTLRVTTSLGNIICTPDHKFYTTSRNTVEAKILKPLDVIASENGNEMVVSITLVDSLPVYDLLEVNKNHRFYANGLLVSNCEFVINDETLISPIKLFDLSGVDPLEMQGQIRWYKKPTKDCIYLAALDPSLGTGGDMSAIQVFEAPTMIQVAEWQNNKTPIQKQISILADITKSIAEYTNKPEDIYYSVENNTLGEAALVSIAEIGEENIIGTFLSEPARAGNVRRYRKGFNTTQKSKISACAKFKSLVENDKMRLASNNLISEMKTFVASGGSYAAKNGHTDDLVMASLLIIRMMLTLKSYIPSLDDYMADRLDEMVMPLPFIMS